MGGGTQARERNIHETFKGKTQIFHNQHSQHTTPFGSKVKVVVMVDSSFSKTQSPKKDWHCPYPYPKSFVRIAP